MRSGTVPGPSRALQGADGALAVLQTKYTLIDEQDIPLVESYSFEVRGPAARAPLASFHRVLGLLSPPGLPRPRRCPAPSRGWRCSGSRCSFGFFLSLCPAPAPGSAVPAAPLIGGKRTLLSY